MQMQTSTVEGAPGPWTKAKPGGKPCAGTGSCVNARRYPSGHVELGDPDATGKGSHTTTGPEWASFVEGVKRGDFDDI